MPIYEVRLSNGNTIVVHASNEKDAKAHCEAPNVVREKPIEGASVKGVAFISD